MRSDAALAGALLALCSIVAAGCGGGGDGEDGTVEVLYAGSLAGLMENDLGPAFARASGDGYEGYGAGSTELAQQIKGKVRQGDVFISAGEEADTLLRGKGNGEWVLDYTRFARTPLVLGYDPGSRFAAALRSRPWYEVLEEPGIRVGRTDPKLDPKGALTLAAARAAAAELGRPSLLGAVKGFPPFPEEGLVGRLQAGQLDAGFFYRNEAIAAGIPTISLAPASEHATFTVAILNGAPDPAAAADFVHYLLGPAGRATLRRQGLTVTAR